MTRFDDEFDPADAIDRGLLDELTGTQGELDEFDGILSDDDLALLRPPSRPKATGGHQRPSSAKKRGKT